MTDTRLRPLRVGRARIHFFIKSNAAVTATIAVKTETGVMQVSTPEETAFDLVRYTKRVGGPGHVATVLKELSEKLDSQALPKFAKKEPEPSVVQRLGYLLDLVGATRVTKPLTVWLARRKSSSVALRPAKKPVAHPPRNRWKVFVNEKIEPDI